MLMLKVHLQWSTSSTLTRSGMVRSSSDQRCSISISPRLHVTLIGMHSEGYRRNGGVGFCVAQPSATITVTSAPFFKVDDIRKHPLQPREQSRLIDVASKFARR